VAFDHRIEINQAEARSSKEIRNPKTNKIGAARNTISSVEFGFASISDLGFISSYVK
jgi:hypothetical protein